MSTRGKGSLVQSWSRICVSLPLHVNLWLSCSPQRLQQGGWEQKEIPHVGLVGIMPKQLQW